MENNYFKTIPTELAFIHDELGNDKISVGQKILEDLTNNGHACIRVVCEQFDDMERLYGNVSGFVMNRGLAQRFWCRKTTFDPDIGYSFLVIDLEKADDFTRFKFKQFQDYQSNRTSRPGRKLD